MRSILQRGTHQLKIIRPPLEYDTQIEAFREDIKAFISDFHTDNPSKTFLYLSNAVTFPRSGDSRYRFGMSYGKTQEVLQAIASKADFAEGSLVLSYPTIFNPTLQIKRDGILQPLNLPISDSISTMKSVQIRLTKSLDEISGIKASKEERSEIEAILKEYGGMYLAYGKSRILP